MRAAAWLMMVMGALSAATVSAAQISGEYLEARSCDVYTGPCFANAEMELAGKEAVMAWKVEEGGWDNVSLVGLSVAVVANSERTMGDTGVFRMKAGQIKSVILVDERASPAQQAALVAFAKSTAKEFTANVVKVQSVPMSLENNHLAGKGRFTAGEVAKIETRGLGQGDCICTNEMVYYQPLTKVADFSPAYSQTFSYTGAELDNTFTLHNQRSAFLATFRR